IKILLLSLRNDGATAMVSRRNRNALDEATIRRLLARWHPFARFWRDRSTQNDRGRHSTRKRPTEESLTPILQQKSRGASGERRGGETEPQDRYRAEGLRRPLDVKRCGVE